MAELFDKHGGFRRLHSFTLATIVQLETLRFCRRFLTSDERESKTKLYDPKGRQFDQMTQAARSGRQNIIEGSERSSTSKDTEMKHRMWRVQVSVNFEGILKCLSSIEVPYRGRCIRNKQKQSTPYLSIVQYSKMIVFMNQQSTRYLNERNMLFGLMTKTQSLLPILFCS